MPVPHLLLEHSLSISVRLLQFGSHSHQRKRAGELTFSVSALATSKYSLVLQRSPQSNDLWIVNHQHRDRYPSNLCSGLQLRTSPDEVVRPAVASGAVIEKLSPNETEKISIGNTSE